jgi:DNA-binding IclR family transcriptional regulator
MQRVATIIESEPRDLTLRTDAVRLARRTGLSKSLARRCLRQLEKQKVIISPS